MCHQYKLPVVFCQYCVIGSIIFFEALAVTNFIMTKKEEILMRNLCRQRRDVDRKKSSDLDYFKLWKRVYPDTFKNVIRAMDEYAELKAGGKK